MFENFQLVRGKTPSERDKLNTEHNDGAISSATFFSNRLGLLSGHPALFRSSLLRTLATSHVDS
jgi:hypothetical protein